MPEVTIKPKLDIIFKKLFSENIDLLHELLSSLLRIPTNSIKDIVIKNSEILPDSIAGKFVRMDLNMEVDGKLINVEMQYGNDSYYKDRTLYYWARLYGGNLKSGEGYKDLKQSICINIVNFPVFGCKEFHSHFTMTEKTRHEELTDKCAIHFFELTKISKTANKEDITELWLQLINAESEEEFDMLEQTGVAPIQKAVYTLHKMSEDEKLKEIARIREKALHDEASAMHGARQEGLNEGLAKGLAKGKAEIVRNMRSIGVPVSEIAKLTGLSSDEVERLL